MNRGLQLTSHRWPECWQHDPGSRKTTDSEYPHHKPPSYDPQTLEIQTGRSYGPGDPVQWYNKLNLTGASHIWKAFSCLLFLCPRLTTLAFHGSFHKCRWKSRIDTQQSRSLTEVSWLKYCFIGPNMGKSKDSPCIYFCLKMIKLKQ